MARRESLGLLRDRLADDAPFRLYRESNIYREDKETTWISIAGTIDEIRVVAAQLEEIDGTPAAVSLKHKIEMATLRFEDGEKRRQKREYRLTRKALFSQPSRIPLYEGRTRGKRIKYTFSDAEDDAGSSFDGLLAAAVQDANPLVFLPPDSEMEVTTLSRLSLIPYDHKPNSAYRTKYEDVCYLSW
ncbi:hypothetical protein FPQ18DRAFT_421100 [Pyronema domesticum]|nr:hypothetical protein FPQ18DRAFT_421100 [Pyronema domesticum]